MDIASLVSFNASSLSASGLINSPILQHYLGHDMMHAFFSAIRKYRKSRLPRIQRRKILNRKRRWFTDNVIMHHKRIHDKNRQMVVSEARQRAISKDPVKKKRLPQEPGRWRDRVEIKDKGKIIRGRISAKRMRARSRWLSVADVSIG